MKSSIRNEIKAQIIRAGYTMQEVVDQLHDEYGWSDSVSNLSGKLQRESLRYREAVELADVLGYDIVWQKRRDGGNVKMVMSGKLLFLIGQTKIKDVHFVKKDDSES